MKFAATVQGDGRLYVSRLAILELARCQGVDLSDDASAPWPVYIAETPDAVFISLTEQPCEVPLRRWQLGRRRRLILTAALARGWRPGDRHTIEIDSYSLTFSLTPERLR